VNQAQLAEWLEQSDRCGTKKDSVLLLMANGAPIQQHYESYSTDCTVEQDAAKAESLRMSELHVTTVPLPTKGYKELEATLHLLPQPRSEIFRNSVPRR